MKAAGSVMFDVFNRIITLITVNPGTQKPFDFVYPKKFTRIYLPKDFSGNRQSVVFEITYVQPQKPLFWYLDGKYMATTQNIHKLALQPESGLHRLIVSDSEGNRIEKSFTVLNKE